MSPRFSPSNNHRGSSVFGLASLLLALTLSCRAASGLDWPSNRLLPAFPAPAARLDCVELSRAAGTEADLFASLEGIVNRRQPRLAVAVGRNNDQLDWLRLHHLEFSVIPADDALLKYRGAVRGLIVTDPEQPATLNLATTLAGLNDELICAPGLLSKLTNAPFHFQIKDDLRGRFSSALQVYEYLLTNCWPRCTHRLIAGMGPHLHGSLRDYLIAVKAAVVWLDARDGPQAALLGRFASGMKPAGSLYMGWWPDEDAGLKWIGPRGIPVLASDFFDNGSVYSGVRAPISRPPAPPPPPLEKKIYLALFLSDGDNVQYMQHRLRHLWNDPARGSVPIGWTVSPLAADLDPAMLAYYQATATADDCLVSGPSGEGYARLDFWKAADLDAFTRRTEPYLRRSGLRIITVWLRVNRAIGESFAANCPTLLGLISHEGGGFTRQYGRLPVIGLASDANYDGSIADLRAGILKAARGWDGTNPLFVAAQANSWDVTPSDLRELAASLDSKKFVVVRPDQLFQLFNQSARASAPIKH